MAVNQVSLFFYPPRWRQRLVVEDPKTLNPSGTSNDSPPPLEEWASLVVHLCQRFELRLGGNGLTSCGEADFLAAVRQHPSYREFAAAFNWPS